MTTYLVSNFASRLQEALAARDMTAAELSKVTGINEGTISNYKQGKYKPKQDKLELISTALNVSAGWLLGADVPMTNTPTSTYSATQPIFSEPLKTAIELFARLDSGDQHKIIGRMETMLEDEKYLQQEASSKNA
ncbi:MAG: helix-turn-helix domain-containing protein [Firmicutes bacterium]|nr:helix-turn-helix domain-containing protein [Bacillota bacterium]